MKLSTKNDKTTRKIVKKQAKETFIETLRYVQQAPFKVRWNLAMKILFPKKH